MNKGKVIIAGGSGFIGGHLADFLAAQGYEPVILTRSPEALAGNRARQVKWDGQTLGEWVREIDGARAVINLAGKNVNCRYTPRVRDEINQSRMYAVRVMHEAIARCARPPRVLIQASSLPIYGDAGDRICDETAPPGMGFPVETCLLWEDEFNRVPTPDTRRVIVRIGFVLGPGGGVLKTLSRITRCFLGGTIGTGRQCISWLHIRDLCRIFAAAIEREEISGVINACTPTPLPNADFMRALRRAVNRPWAPPTPAWLVHLGSWIIRTEPCLALTGRRAIPRKLMDVGFEFQFRELGPALEDSLQRRARWRIEMEEPATIGSAPR
jgi:uncharacterized protein (TIGR01777 family)